MRRLPRVLKNMLIPKIRIIGSDLRWRILIPFMMRLEEILLVDFLLFMMDMEVGKFLSTVLRD